MSATANASIVDRSATSARDMASAHFPEYGAGVPGSNTVNSGYESRRTPNAVVHQPFGRNCSRL